MPSPVAVPVVLTSERTRAVAGVGAAADVGAGVGVAVADCLGVRGWLMAARTARSRRRWGRHGRRSTKWRNRFAVDRLDGLLDEPRPGRPRTIADADVERVIVTTLETTPRDATHWSTRSLAAQVGLSQTAVSRIWRAFGLQPHRQDTWKLSKDPQFIAKVRDVVGLYLDPPERAVVLCVDEKSQIQALDRTAPVLPMLPGTPARASHDYVRAGTSSLYAALNLATGKVIGSLHARHRAVEFKKFLATLDRQVPAGPGRARRAGQRLHPQDPGRQTVAGRASPLRRCTSPRPAARGSTWSNAGSVN